MSFIIPQQCKELLRLQVVQYCNDESAPFNLSVLESDTYAKWLPCHPRRVLDLSCGMGRTTVMVHQLCGDTDTTYYLLDRSHTSNVESWVGGYNPPQEEWCCDLNLTVEFCRENMTGGNLVPLEMTDDWELEIEPIDLIISTLAVGFHWPFRPWLERLEPFTTEDAVAILGVRNGVHEVPPKSWSVVERVSHGPAQDFVCFRKGS